MTIASSGTIGAAIDGILEIETTSDTKGVIEIVEIVIMNGNIRDVRLLT